MQEKNQPSQGLRLDNIIEEGRGTGNHALDAMLRSRTEVRASDAPEQPMPAAAAAASGTGKPEPHLSAAAPERVLPDAFAPRPSVGGDAFTVELPPLEVLPPEPLLDMPVARTAVMDAQISPTPARGKKTKEHNMPRKKKKRGAKVAAALAAAAIALTGSAFAYTYLYPGIHIGVRAGAVPVGGMTVAEAQKAIDSQAERLLSGKSVSLNIYKTDYEIDVDSVTTGLDSTSSAQQAYAFTHDGNPLTRVGNAVNALFGGYEVPLSVSIDEAALTGRLHEIEAEALTEPVQPSWELQTDTLVIDTGKPGVGFDTAAVAKTVTDKIRTMDFNAFKVDVTTRDQQAVDLAAIQAEAEAEPQNATVDKNDGKSILPSVDGVKMDLEKAKSIVGDGTEQTYTIPVTRTPAEINADQLSEVLFRDTLASTSTKLNAGNTPRTKNVRLASEHMNGTILNPGDEFSYNGVVGERTAARGFSSAGAYANGRVIDEVGGGVCQPSSTLYMAVLRADLEVTERHNHSLTVAYTPLGEDATVSWGGPDFRFRNDTKYPVKVYASQSGSSMSITIKGTKTSDKSVKLKTEVLETLSFTTVEKKDNSLAAGARSTSQSGSNGYKTVTYKIITENGETKTVKANNSSYKKKDKIVLVGPAVPDPVPEPTPTPAPAQAGDPEGT